MDVESHDPLLPPRPDHHRHSARRLAPNGILNNDDFYYLAQFAAGNLAVADMTTTAIPGSPGWRATAS